MARLTITDHNGKTIIHELVDDVTTFGRSSSCTIKVTDEKSSRQHFRVEKDGERFKVVDLGSTNGTKLNGQKVTSEFLCPDDVMGLGKTKFHYEGPGEKRAPVEKVEDEEDDPIASFEATIELDEDLPADLEKIITSSLDEDKPKYVLKMTEGPESGSEYELGVEPTTIGRKSGNTIKITDGSASSFHVEIKKEPIGYVISDLGSTNGTKVKSRNSDAFEKIVKTPLVVGAQIKIGKTIFEFQNVGAANEDDEMFGTIVLDADNLTGSLGDDIAPRPAAPSTPLALPSYVIMGAAMFVFIAVVFLVVKLVGDDSPGASTDGPKKKIPSVASTGNIENSDFSQGTDDYGNPKGWKRYPGEPGIRIDVSPDADLNPETPGDLKMGLVIHKSGARSLSCRSTVETRDTLSVDPGKVYELGGWLRNEGDGLYGLRVVWVKGNRKVAEHPIVLRGQQEAKWKTALVRPPTWADRVLVGVFVEGQEGKSFFDDIQFKKVKKKLARAPEVQYAGITARFEGRKGIFSVLSGGVPGLQGGALELIAPDGKSVSSLLSGIEPSLSSEGSSVTIQGRLHDYSAQVLTNYRVAVSRGRKGIKMKFAIDAAPGRPSSPRLRFAVVGKFGKGKMEISSDSKSSKKSGGSRIQEKAVKDILLNSGSYPQLYLSFNKPVGLIARREGGIMKMIIAFSGELIMEIAPENVRQKLLLAQALRKLDDVARKRDWPTVYKLKEQVYLKFAARFPEAKDRIRKINTQMEAAWDEDRQRMERELATAEKFNSVGAAEKSLDLLGRKWIGTPHEEDIISSKGRLKVIRERGLSAQDEKDSQRKLAKAKKSRAAGGGALQIALLLAKAIIRDYPNSSAAEEAKAFLPEVQKEKEKYDRLSVLTDRLKMKGKPFARAGEYKKAIRVIKADKDYKDNSADLKELNKLLKDWATLATR